VVGICKTEASQKAIPLHEDLIGALKGWRQQNPYKEAQRRRIRIAESAFMLQR
jgi:hypothetical protein